MYAQVKRSRRRARRRERGGFRGVPALVSLVCIYLLCAFAAGCGQDGGGDPNPLAVGQPNGADEVGSPSDSTGGGVLPDTTGGGAPPEDPDEPGGGVPPDSIGGGDFGQVRIAAELDGRPLEGVSLGVVSETGLRTLRASDAAGVVDFLLPAGHYTIAAVPTWFDEEAPWLRVLSIEPAEVDVVADGEVTALVRVERNPYVPEPAGAIVVWVGAPADSVSGPPTNPVEPPPVAVRVLSADSGEEVAQGMTLDRTIEFSLAPGLYDLEIAVPEGYALAAGSDNPQRGIRVGPRQTRAVSFRLLPPR